MPGFLANLSKSYREQLLRYRNRGFLRAAMAACATVAMVDGIVSLRQRMRVDQVMETLDALKVFDPHEGVNLFNEFVDAMRTDPQAGHDDAVAVIVEEVDEEPDKAELLIRICLAVSEREGVIPVTEQIEIVALCSRLGLKPRDCGLDAEGGETADAARSER